MNKLLKVIFIFICTWFLSEVLYFIYLKTMYSQDNHFSYSKYTYEKYKNDIYNLKELSLDRNIDTIVIEMQSGIITSSTLIKNKYLVDSIEIITHFKDLSEKSGVQYSSLESYIFKQNNISRKIIIFSGCTNFIDNAPYYDIVITDCEDISEFGSKFPFRSKKYLKYTKGVYMTLSENDFLIMSSYKEYDFLYRKIKNIFL